MKEALASRAKSCPSRRSGLSRPGRASPLRPLLAATDRAGTLTMLAPVQVAPCPPARIENEDTNCMRRVHETW